MEQADADIARAGVTGNRYNRMEWAGAFGDLGTLVPFVVAYNGTVGMDPFGILRVRRLAYRVRRVLQDTDASAYLNKRNLLKL